MFWVGVGVDGAGIPLQYLNAGSRGVILVTEKLRKMWEKCQVGKRFTKFLDEQFIFLDPQSGYFVQNHVSVDFST